MLPDRQIGSGIKLAYVLDHIKFTHSIQWGNQWSAMCLLVKKNSLKYRFFFLYIVIDIEFLHYINVNVKDEYIQHLGTTTCYNHKLSVYQCKHNVSKFNLDQNDDVSTT